MEELKIIEKYFDFLDDEMRLKLKEFLNCLAEWNQKINLVSRSDMDHLVEHHLIPSLSISKICKFSSASTVLDVGTGGGFPGIPLAICFPETNFLLIDSIRKKTHAVAAMAQTLRLKNVKVMQVRVEDLDEKFDFVVGRAVTALPKFINWVKTKIRAGSQSSLPNGILYLKGGDFEEEVKELGIEPTKVYPLGLLFNNEYCQDKCLIYFDYKSLNRRS